MGHNLKLVVPNLQGNVTYLPWVWAWNYIANDSATDKSVAHSKSGQKSWPEKTDMLWRVFGRHDSPKWLKSNCWVDFFVVWQYKPRNTLFILDRHNLWFVCQPSFCFRQIIKSAKRGRVQIGKLKVNKLKKLGFSLCVLTKIWTFNQLLLNLIQKVFFDFFVRHLLIRLSIKHGHENFIYPYYVKGIYQFGNPTHKLTLPDIKFNTKP